MGKVIDADFPCWHFLPASRKCSPPKDEKQRGRSGIDVAGAFVNAGTGNARDRHRVRRIKSIERRGLTVLQATAIFKFLDRRTLCWQ
jgi:hypothetical protein